MAGSSLRSAYDEAARTSKACQICRDKKVKCSGQQPCRYCAQRRLDCVFAPTAKRRLVSTAQIQELQDKVAFYEQQQQSPLSATGNAPVSRSRVSESPQLDSNVAPQSSFSAEGNGISTDSQLNSAPTPGRQGRAIAPESALSSSETFGSEIKTLFVSRSGPSSTARASASAASPILEVCRCWPSEDEAYAMLDLVVLQVGISQQLFDARAFADNLSRLYQDTNSETELPGIWILEMLLVCAIGRLMQGKSDDNGDFPGTEFFQEAMGRMPVLTDIRKHGILGVEVVGLAALYLQIADRKDDAYLHANMALRLAISHGLHRESNGSSSRQRPANVHRNRLWWSQYMQERRLCAAGGYPMSIGDYAISAPPPYDAAGYPSATSMAVNVRTARITGQITSTIYSHKEENESVFVANVQKILRSLHDIEADMPREFLINFNTAGLAIAGLPFSDTSQTTARASASLYISIYSAVIHTVRPILLYMARHSRDDDPEPDPEAPRSKVSPVLRRLAEICVEAASKTLAIVQELHKREMITKHAFLDLDATFSVGFIFVLVEAINPGNGLGFNGIEGSREILRSHVRCGNGAAAKRLSELDQMCLNLALPVEHDQVTTTATTTSPLAQTSLPNTAGTGVLTQAFSFESGYGTTGGAQMDCRRDGMAGNVDTDSTPQAREGVSDNRFPTAKYDQLGLSNTDLANIPLEGENSLYWVYHSPGLLLTGVEQADWEALESQLP